MLTSQKLPGAGGGAGAKCGAPCKKNFALRKSFYSCLHYIGNSMVL